MKTNQENTVKQITKKEAFKLIEEVAHQANISVEIWGAHEKEEFCIVNQGQAFKMSGENFITNNTELAKYAMKMIKRYEGEFSIYSSYFSSATGNYLVTDIDSDSKKSIMQQDEEEYERAVAQGWHTPIYESAKSDRVIAFASSGYDMSEKWWGETHKRESSVYQTPSGRLKRCIEY